jgi:hypothetical protein
LGRYFDYIKFPAYMKPVADGKRIPFRKQRRILGETPRNRSISYDASGRDCFTEYFRVYCLGGKAVRIMQYEPRNEPHLRYVIDGPPVDKNYSPP